VLLIDAKKVCFNEVFYYLDTLDFAVAKAPVEYPEQLAYKDG